MNEREMWDQWLRWHNDRKPLTPSERTELMAFWISGGCDLDGPIGFRAGLLS